MSALEPGRVVLLRDLGRPAEEVSEGEAGEAVEMGQEWWLDDLLPSTAVLLVHVDEDFVVGVTNYAWVVSNYSVYVRRATLVEAAYDHSQQAWEWLKRVASGIDDTVKALGLLASTLCPKMIWELHSMGMLPGGGIRGVAKGLALPGCSPVVEIGAPRPVRLAADVLGVEPLAYRCGEGGYGACLPGPWGSDRLDCVLLEEGW